MAMLNNQMVRWFGTSMNILPLEILGHWSRLINGAIYTYLYHIWLVVTGTMEFYMTFPSYWEWNNHPNLRTPSFFRGVGLNHQPGYIGLV